MMARVKLEVRRLSPSEKVTRAEQIVASLKRRVDRPIDSLWTHDQVAINAAATVSTLTRATKYGFRVAAVKANGQSGWSQPSTGIAP